MKIYRLLINSCLLTLMLCAVVSTAQAQTTVFNFQGRLNDGTSPANGRYDLEFKLFDAITGGNQINSTISKPNLMLVNGVFSTQLDFGLPAFSGADRFIEISLRATGSGNAFVILGPRQQILSVPYTVRSNRATLADEATHAVNADNATTANNALNLGGTPAAAYLKMDSNGNVGIGTSNPTAKLEIAAQEGVKISGFQPFISLNDTSAGAGGYHKIQSANGAMYFYLGTAVGAKMVIDANGNVGIGVNSVTAKFEVNGRTKTGILEITGGSDLAEKFEFSETVNPGMVVAIDPNNIGKLTLARGAYNRRVAGVISGANNLSAGMVLPDLKGASKDAQPVALSGRVWVYCDATTNPVRAGDLLTTSSVPGYAMKITNYKRAAGATIGKAMTELKSGKGLVLVLVSLQ